MYWKLKLLGTFSPSGFMIIDDEPLKSSIDETENMFLNASYTNLNATEMLMILKILTFAILTVEGGRANALTFIR